MPKKKELSFSVIIRKAAPAFFIMVFFLPITFTCAVFKIRQITIHKTIQDLRETGVSKDQLVLLKIPLTIQKENKIFDRTEENEFKYNGNMYDIIRSEKHQNSTWFWCIWDVNETALEKNLREIGNKALGTDLDNEGIEELLSLFMNFLFLKPTQSEIPLPFKDLLCTSRFSMICNLNPPAAPPTPPPKC
ncbi:MAG TPA: hypothetical protein VK541_09365 [Pedobacter sp.]|uniref:hypothetical protein n=1 Tax=Pedobacter sp. TaxID=1411316 RepID=UPI002BF868FB|nr:hypothetical protein [Pedobacter sp.]HMI02678.1 hypothetical protein [Pedobacter sp.]